MNTRERFLNVMNFRPFDRLPMIEWASWWDQTLERWYGEGLPKNITDKVDLFRHFGLDVHLQDWFALSDDGCPEPASHGAGIMTDEKDYEAIRPHFFKCPLDKARWEKWAAEQSAGNAVLWFTFQGFFWFPRQLFGIEKHLFAFYDEPQLMHRINSDLTEWMLKMIDDVCAVCTPDFMTFAEDMSYNLGSMLSKELFDEFLRPYYDKVVPVLKSRGIIPIIDSDGDITVPAHWFEEAGLAGILPLERQAKVDIARLRTEHPTMRFIGHFDKMCMSKGEPAMRAEFERLLPTAAKGGFIISVDHQTPPGVSYENYLIYLKLFREYAERAGKISQGKEEKGKR